MTGDNLVAVEVHQDTSNNVDSSFDLELVRQTPTETTPPPRPTLNLTSAEDSTVALSLEPRDGQRRDPRVHHPA